jgi:TRAP-type uncharacterized transport system substrate-binding protein
MTTDISRRNVALAELIRSEAADHRLDIVPTAKEYGTLDALEEIDSPSEVKLALIVGGVTKRNYPHVRTVTSLTKEHLHLLVKPGFAGKGIAGLRGKRIFLGPPTRASLAGVVAARNGAPQSSVSDELGSARLNPRQ